MQRDRSCLDPTVPACFLSLAALVIPEQDDSLGRSRMLSPSHSALWLCRDSDRVCVPAMSSCAHLRRTFLWNARWVCGQVWNIKYTIKWSGQSSVSPSLVSLKQLLLGIWFLVGCYEQSGSGALLSAAPGPSALGCWLWGGTATKWHSSRFPPHLPGDAQLLVPLPLRWGIPLCWVKTTLLNHPLL